MHNVNNLEKSKMELIKDILADIKQNPWIDTIYSLWVFNLSGNSIITKMTVIDWIIQEEAILSFIKKHNLLEQISLSIQSQTASILE